MHLRTTTIRRNDKIYRYAQLVESFRGDDGRPTTRLVAHLGALTDEQVCNLKLALEASRTHRALVLPDVAAHKAPAVLANFAYLDVAVALEMWRHWDLDELLASVLPGHEHEVRPELVVASLVVQRCVDPGSKLYAERWFPRTALPELLSISPGQFNNTRIHRVLDLLEQSTEPLQTELARRYEARSAGFTALFLDVTDTWFVGHGPPDLAQKGKTKEGLYERKIGIVLMCNEAGLPLRWELVAGRQNDGEAMLNLLEATRKVCWLGDAPVVMDRALGRTAYLRKLLQLGQRFLTALTEDEFEAYTDRIPHDAVQAIDAFSEDAAQQARKAVVARGMVEHKKKVLLLDLGVIERREAAEPPSEGAAHAADPLRETLELASRMSKEMEDGKANNCRQLGTAHGLKKERVAKVLTLLRLAPDLQDFIRAGAASKLSIASALRIAQLANPQQQREAFNQQLASAASSGTRSVPKRRAPVTPAANDEDPPVRVRAVLCFNPDQFVEQRRGADETLGQINAFVNELNRQLQSPKSRRTKQQAYALVHAELKRRNLIEAYEIDVRNTEGSLHVQLTLCAQHWRQRRRFDGFSILVAHPEVTSEPGELDRLYRAKDAVEKDFHVIKSVVQLRPVRHRKESKIRAHVTLCMLALLLERTIEHRLASTKATAMTAESCFELLGSVHLNRINHATAPVYTVTHADSDQRAILDALGLAHLTDDEVIMPRITPR